MKINTKITRIKIKIIKIEWLKTKDFETSFNNVSGLSGSSRPCKNIFCVHHEIREDHFTKPYGNHTQHGE